ncbi:short-chain dehydrogenase/reductase [Ilyonectria sp. MPI-CAGE-AT-0026]|nr:short-chain dehydrogenase/reductase [Ilyonectria sp. MPI-CAGE-AT-0026]
MPLFGGKGVNFSPAKDIPALTGKVIIVTGGNSGLGKQSVLELARHKPSEIWLAARSLQKAQAAADDIKTQVPNAPVKLLELDLGSLESVQNAAETFCASSSRLDILMLNAGIMAHPPSLTRNGYEIQFGTNHVGHALLTKLLLPLLLKTAENDPNADARVVCLSSASHRQAPVGGILFDKLKTKSEGISEFSRYGQSKLANALFARELARRYPSLKVASVHPGSIATNLFEVAATQSLLIRGARTLGSPFLSSVENGVKSQLWAATSKEVTSGEYYESVGVKGMASKYAKDDDLARELWAWTEKELQSYDN